MLNMWVPLTLADSLSPLLKITVVSRQHKYTKYVSRRQVAPELALNVTAAFREKPKMRKNWAN